MDYTRPIFGENLMKIGENLMKKIHMLKHTAAAIVAAAMMFGPTALAGEPVGSAFTYQGQLKHNGEPIAGSVNFAFRLYDSNAGGSQVGPEIESIGFSSFDDDGRFTIDLGFGQGVIQGDPLWLEVRVNGAPLSPRQPLMPAPVAMFALDGNEGPQGEQGPAGPQGDPGPTGPTGSQGPQGDAGSTGPQGPQGSPGPTGSQGPQGDQGEPGPTGPQGMQGPEGPMGLMGLSGIVSSGHVSGLGTPPSDEWQFAQSNPLVVTVTEPGQRVYVTGTRAFGSFVEGGARELHYSIGHRPVGSTDPPHAMGAWMLSMRVPENTLLPFTNSAVISGLAAGEYEVGLVYRVEPSEVKNWFTFGRSFTTALVFETQ